MRFTLLPVSFACALLLGACATDPAIKEGEARNRQIAAGTWRLSELRLACMGNPASGLPGRPLTDAEAQEQRAIVEQISALEPVIWTQVPLSLPRVEEFRRICAGDPATGTPARALTAEERTELLTLLGAVIAGAPSMPGSLPPSGGMTGGTTGADGTIIWSDGDSWRPDPGRYDNRDTYDRDRWRWEQERRQREWLWELERQRQREAYEWRLREERRRRREAEQWRDRNEHNHRPPPVIVRPDPDRPPPGRPGTQRPPVNDDAARRAAEQARDRLDQQRRDAERDLQRQTDQARDQGEAARRQAEAEQSRAAEQERINQQAEEARRRLDEKRRDADAEQRRAAEQDRINQQADEARRRQDESRREVETEARRQAEERRRELDEARRQVQEEQQRQRNTNQPDAPTKIE